MRGDDLREAVHAEVSKHAWGSQTDRGWRCACGMWTPNQSAHVTDSLLALLATPSEPEATVVEERWVPVAESGERWTPRMTEAAARACLLDYPAGGTWADGQPWDGVTHIVHERRRVTEWEEVDDLG